MSTEPSQRRKPRLRVIASPAEAEAVMRGIGSDEAGVRLMAPKTVTVCIFMESVPLHWAQILKEEMLSAGGEVARTKGAVNWSVDSTDILLAATVRQYRRVIKKLRAQPFGLAALADDIERLIANAFGGQRRVMKCGGRELILGERTLIMGILNVTSDSFSGDGVLAGAAEGAALAEAALARARVLAADGADMIDVGGESSRPGARPVNAADEIARVVPAVKAIAGEMDLPISIDTYKSEVAKAAIEAGATIVNDSSGLRLDPKIAEIVAQNDIPLVVMHMKGTPENMQDRPEYADVVGDIIGTLDAGVGRAVAAGVDENKIIVDPGIGFGKTMRHNLDILRRLSELRTLGKPILVGTSRKSFIGSVLDLPPEERIEGTAATVALAVAGGADIVRVHDVKEMTRVARMSDAVVRRRSDAQQ